MVTVIVVVVAVCLGAAFREVKASLIDAAGIRAQGAASQLATLLAQSAQQRLAELHRAATDPAVREYLLHPGEQTRQGARLYLAGLTSPNPQIIELWTSAGQKVLSVPAAPGVGNELPSGAAPLAAGIGPLRLHGSTVSAESVTRVESLQLPDDNAPQTLGSLGFMVVRRPILVSSNASTLTGLVGNGATVKVGNTAGQVWTDLSRPVDGPPVEAAHSGVKGYRGADGRRYLGTVAAIGGTPWSVWVEFPESAVLAPARSFLRRMVIIVSAVLIVTAVGLRTMTERLLRPLSALTQASEAIAAGDYSRRISTTRRDEIGRLGAVFNTMTEHVEHAHRDLEERVQRRTATLEETSARLRERARELKDSREELDQFFSLTPDMLCIADAGGRFTRVNAAWQDALGWMANDLTGAPYLSFVHPDDVGATIAETAKLAAGGVTLQFENRYRCKDGSFRWLSWRAAPAMAGGLIYAAARDVTAEKRSAQILEERAVELGTLNRELEAFSHSVSHDLRAPLRHIGGFAALLRDSAATTLDANGHRLLETIMSATTQMGRLIDDLLAFSRVGRTPLARAAVSLNALVREVQQEIMTGVDRHIEWQLHDLPVLHGDRSLLRLVFVNLLSNAVKYSSTRAEARIEIGTVPAAAEEIVVYVRDNGVGFDLAYVHKLFGVFQRLHSAEEFEGTGIGLANVKRIVQRHGGRVWAESTLGQGAAFYVAWPIAQSS